MSERKNLATLENNTKSPSLWGWPTYASIALTTLILVSLIPLLDWDEIWWTVAASNKELLLIGGLAHYATYAVRGLRWRRCLAHLPMNARWGTFGLLVFFCNFVDNVVPGKLADVYAAHLARINCGVRRSAAMGSIVFLRMVDAWVVLLLASMASWILFSTRLPDSVFWTLILGTLIAFAVSFIMLAFILSRNVLPRWLPDQIQQMIRAFHTGMRPSPSQMIPIGVLTIIIWALETLWVVALVLAFGVKLSPVTAIFLTTIPLLASAFPLTPSGAGVVEVTLFSCLRVLGVTTPIAVSITVMNRLIDYWLHIGLGMLTWAFRRPIGLRTWRDVPVEESPGVTLPEIEVVKEALREA